MGDVEHKVYICLRHPFFWVLQCPTYSSESVRRRQRTASLMCLHLQLTQRLTWTLNHVYALFLTLGCSFNKHCDQCGRHPISENVQIGCLTINDRQLILLFELKDLLDHYVQPEYYLPNCANGHSVNKVAKLWELQMCRIHDSSKNYYWPLSLWSQLWVSAALSHGGIMIDLCSLWVFPLRTTQRGGGGLKFWNRIHFTFHTCWVLSSHRGVMSHVLLKPLIKL